MGSFANRTGAEYVKMLFMGASGTGKTGALSSLVNKLGMKLLIIDFDNGADILLNYVTDPKLRAGIFSETLTDPMKGMGDEVVPDGTPTAFSRGMSILTSGVISGDKPGEKIQLGRPANFGPQWVVVIDSLTHAARAAYHFNVALNTGKPKFDKRMNYFHAQEMLLGMLALLKSVEFNAHVIVNCHVDWIEDTETETFDENGGRKVQMKGMPMSIGKAIADDIPTYFNTLVRAKTIGSGNAAKRTIQTTTQGTIDLKNSMPSKLPSELILDTGLAVIFQTLTGKTSFLPITAQGASTPATVS